MRRRGCIETNDADHRGGHDVSNLWGRRVRRGPGSISMTVIGPPQQGQGTAPPAVSASDVSSSDCPVAAGAAVTINLRIVASFVRR